MVKKILLSLTVCSVGTSRADFGSTAAYSIAGTAIVSAVTYGVYTLYKGARVKVSAYVDTYVEDAAVEAIVLAFKKPSSCTEEELSKKAHLICRRGRIVKALDEKIEQGHAFRKKFDKIKMLFSAIDLFRKVHKDEQKYANPSIVDRIEEERIVQSILLSIKPDDHCTQHELEKKETARKKRKKILSRLVAMNPSLAKNELVKLILV